MENKKIIREWRDDYSPFPSLFGVKVTRMEEGYAEAEVPVTDKVKNPIGSVHGGCLFSLADVAASAAAYSYGDKCTTADCSFHFLRAALHDAKKVVAKAKVRKRGRNLITIDVDVCDDSGSKLCFAIATFVVLGGAIDWEATKNADAEN